ncbi:alpha-galactosidase [Puniceicoccus vermicola]|uniref:Alpha-galactosidase n=1 Tax=Puniceicoccus vermicola TaxID=388746 RepID=A0A7X1AX22_9BACT|nr:alpha-galactosidase [Puniceicoccus vermicola]MBC2601586.1 alpha-galactosidase [Puniceicoccus vermicola]
MSIHKENGHDSDRLEDCYATWEDGILKFGNSYFEERWVQAPDGFLKPQDLRRKGGKIWGDRTGGESVWESEWRVCCSCEYGKRSVSSAEGLIVSLRLESLKESDRWRSFRFQLFPDLAGSILEVEDPSVEGNEGSDANHSLGVHEADGFETESDGGLGVTLPNETLPAWQLEDRHLCLREFQYVDQTDYHSEFAYQREWLMHPSEKVLPMRSNVVSLESVNPDEHGEGVLWVLLAPLGHVRKSWSAPFDFLLAFGEEHLTFRIWTSGYSLARVAYQGGRNGALLAMQRLQKTLRSFGVSAEGTVLSNTWGDRGGARHLSASFLEEEIEAAKEMGVEVLQIDDGWQKGATVNTVEDRSAGVWNGFWEADPNFWEVHPGRFPNGFRPIVEKMREVGIELGLWFAPDSSNEFANWEKDVLVLLGLWRKWGVRYFKLDAVKLTSRLAETRFHQLCEKVLKASDCAIVFDFDATAERRPTYWGRVGGGQLFLENRYTDFGNYYPHQTLRALWTLTLHGILPSRIRLEFLNTTRNPDCYSEGDPLSPERWPADYQVAITLAASPLAWMEMSRVPEERRRIWGDLFKAWQPHRRAFHRGSVLPIGDPPNGFSWTGFLSLDQQEGKTVLYGIIFRELHPDDHFSFSVPRVYELEESMFEESELIAGAGTVGPIEKNRFVVNLPRKRSFVVVRWEISVLTDS